MVDLYVMDHDEFSFRDRDLEGFVRQYHDGRLPFEELELCKSIAEKWREFVRERHVPTRRSVTLPLGRGVLPEGNPPKKPGVYAIFCGRNGCRQRPFFHVGMSTDEVRKRLRTRLDKNVREDYRVFGRLCECSRLWVCYSVVSDCQNGTVDRHKLELLETCLRVYLQGW